MTDRAKRKSDAKIHIRSLLQSAPLGLTLAELRRDYVDYIGTRLPSRDLGYNNDEEFLYDIPDTVQISHNGDIMVLTAVTNAATEKIHRLVSRQKVDTKKKWGVLGRQRSKFQAPRGVGQRRKWDTFGGNGRADFVDLSRPLMFDVRQAKHRVLPSVPSYIRKKIFELVKDEPGGLPLTHFGIIFRKHFGVPFDPVAMGFSTDYDLLASLGDIVTLKKFGEEIRVIEAGLGLFSHHRQQMHTHDDTQYARYNGPVDQSKAQEKPPSKNLLEKSAKETKSQCIEEIKKAKSKKSVTYEDNQQSKLIGMDLNCNIPEFVQENIKQIMAKRPKGICASRLPFEYKETFHCEFPYKTYGYSSVMEFVSDLPHIIKCERPHPQGDWQLYARNGSHPQIEEKASKCQRNQEISMGKSSHVKENSYVQETSYVQESLCSKPHHVDVEKNMKEAIAQVLCMHPDGIPLNKFQETFEEMTGIELDITRYTSDGIKAFLYSMTDILLLTVNPLEQTVVCPKLAGHPRRFDKLLTQYQPIFPPIENQKKEEVLRLPNDAVSPGCFYKAQPLPPAGNGKYIGLYVSNVLSPSVFWIQLRGTDTTLALEDVMDDLERVYTSKTLSKDYLMPLSLAKKGTPCAVIFPEDGFWHRGIITGQQNKLFEVYYVDYGNTCIVSIDQLRLLRTKFLKLPAQAVRARLSNIQPVGGVWKSNSKDKLLDMSREVALVALVTNVKDGVLSLCLTDTNDKDRDVHINDVLVQEGYAYFQPDKEVPQLDMHTQAPSMDLLYGDDEPPVSQEEQPKPTNYRYIRQAQMTDDCIMHLINLDGSLYLLSFEISSLFFDDDIISSMLKHDNFDVPKVVISKVKHPDLFNELLMYGVQKVTEDTNLLSLFSLSVMPLIIEFYGRNIDFTEVKETILEILDWFNPDDPYWKGENDTQDETDTSSSLGDSLELPKLEDLQLVLNTLNIKRKRILSKMASEVHCTPEDVNELTEVELHLKRVEKLISKLESRTSSISSDVSTTAEGFRDPETLNLAEESDAKLESKSTQKVAPIVQENLTSLPTPVPTVAAPDLTAFLLQQRQLMMNSLIMMESLGLTVDPSIVQASVSPSSLGVSQVLTNQQLQQQALQSQLQRQQGSSALANVQDNSSSTRGQGRGLSLDLFSQQPNLSDLRSITQGSGNSLLQNQQLLQESLLQQQQMNALNARIAELTLGRQAAMMNPMNLLMGNSFLRLPNFQQTAPSVPNFQQSAPSVASSGWCNSTSMLQQPTLVSPQSPASSVNLNGRPTPRAAPGLTANALEQSQLFQLQQSLGSQPFSRGTGGSIHNVTPRTTN